MAALYATPRQKLPLCLTCTPPPAMFTSPPEHDPAQPMEDGDEPLASDASGLLMQMDVPSLHAGAERFVAMAEALVKRVLDHYGNDAFEEINILQEDGDEMAFLSDDFYYSYLLRHEEIGGVPQGESEVFLCELDAVEELIEEKHWVIAAVQNAYYAPLGKLLLEPEAPNEACVLVSLPLNPEMWRVPTYCLRFVAILKHWHTIRAWAGRARERANAPGGVGARRAAVEFAALAEAM